MMMIAQGLIQKDFNKVLNGFSWVFIVLLFLKVVLFEIFDHLLTSCTKLRIELYHRHVFDDQVVRASAFLIIIVVPLSIVCSRNHSSLLSLLIDFELLLEYVLLDLALRESLYHVFLVGTLQEVMLIDHSQYWWDVRVHI
jgi:hypothetical protein